MAGTDMYIVAHFTTTNGVYSVQASTDDIWWTDSNGGHYEPGGSVSPLGGSIAVGREVTFNAYLAMGFIFLHWIDEDKGEVLSNSMQYTLTANRDYSIKAVFSRSR